MSLYDALKDAIEVGKQIKNAAMQKAIAAIEIEAAQVTLELAKRSEELAATKDELRAAREELRLRSELVFDRAQNVYWRRLPDEQLDGPFYSGCFDTTGKTIRLHAQVFQNYRQGCCPICKIFVTLASRGGVAEPLADDAHALAGGEQQRRVRVSQVVYAQRWV